MFVYKEIIPLLIVSLILCLGLNHFNLELVNANPTKAYNTLYGVTISSPDNEYYLTPVDNFLKGRGWRRDPPVGNGSYFRRVPGYSLIYLFFAYFFEYPLALQLLKIFHIILFLLSVYCVHRLLILLKVSSISRVIISLLYGCTPFFNSFTFFTITEAISPYLIVFYVYFIFYAYNTIEKYRKLTYYLLASFFIGYAILTRPYTGIAGILLPVFLYKEYAGNSVYNYIQKCIVIGLIPFLMLLAWTLRNYITTGEIVLLEKAHHPQSLDRMKPEFEGFWNFTKSWGEDGSNMNSYQLPFFSATLAGDTSERYVSNIINAWPIYVVEHFGEKRLRNILKKYQNVIYSQKVFYDKQIAMPPFYNKQELEVKFEFEKLASEYKKKFPLQYYILTPLKYLKDLAMHSNTAHLFIFQNEFRHIKLLNYYRYFLIVLHISLYITVVVNLYLLYKDDLLLWTLSIVPLILIMFFVFYFQAIEQRYMLPYLPLLLIGLHKPMDTIINKWKRI